MKKIINPQTDRFKFYLLFLFAVTFFFDFIFGYQLAMLVLLCIIGRDIVIELEQIYQMLKKKYGKQN